MPAVVTLEDLKVAPRDYRSMFLAVTPDALPACSRSPGCLPQSHKAGRRRMLYSFFRARDTVTPAYRNDALRRAGTIHGDRGTSGQLKGEGG